MDKWRNQLISETMPLLKKIVSDVYSKLPQNNSIEYEDLISIASVGLMQAVERFDPSQGAKFSTFAYYRIRGSLYDELRKLGFLNKNNRLLAQSAMEEVLENINDGVKPQEIFDSLALVYTLSIEGGGVEGESIDFEDKTQKTPENVVEIEIIKSSMKILSKQEYQVVYFHYFEDLSLTEIAREMGYSKAWVSRIHSKAIFKLREALNVS